MPNASLAHRWRGIARALAGGLFALLGVGTVLLAAVGFTGITTSGGEVAPYAPLAAVLVGVVAIGAFEAYIGMQLVRGRRSARWKAAVVGVIGLFASYSIVVTASALDGGAFAFAAALAYLAALIALIIGWPMPATRGEPAV